jgi:hypothetical protein
MWTGRLLSDSLANNILESVSIVLMKNVTVKLTETGIENMSSPTWSQDQLKHPAKPLLLASLALSFKDQVSGNEYIRNTTQLPSSESKDSPSYEITVL